MMVVMFYMQLSLLMFCRYWDSAYDEDLLDDRVSMNLLYVQVIEEAFLPTFERK